MCPKNRPFGKPLGICRVVAGCLDNGLGVPILAAAGLEVEVMVGTKLEGAEGRGRAPHVLKNLEAAVASNPWGARVKLTPTEEPDPVTAETPIRLRDRSQRESSDVQAVMTWVEPRRPSAEQVIGEFHRCFDAGRDSTVLASHLAAFWSDPARGRGPLMRLIGRRCYHALNRERDASIMEFERRSAR